MQIETTQIRPNGSIVTLPIGAGLTKTYDFKPMPPDGAHTCDVVDRNHISMLLAIPEAFRVYQSPLTPEEQAEADGRALAEALERERVAAADAAKAELDAASAAAYQAALDHANYEAAQAVLHNRMSAEEAVTYRAKLIAESTDPVPLPSNPNNEPTEQQRVAIQSFEAEQKAALEDAADVRNAGTETITELRAAYKAMFGKIASPKFTAQDLRDKLTAGAHAADAPDAA